MNPVSSIAEPPAVAPPHALVPFDLRLQYGDRSLEEWVWQAVDCMIQDLPRLRSAPSSGPASRQLLALLTFAYATGLYASEDIEHALRHGRLPSSLLPPVPVTSAQLQAFRRANRPWIEQALASLLRRLAEDTGLWINAANLRIETDRQNLDLACIMAARRAVELATLMDSALCD
ncbi:MAG: hypothetical protein RMN51_01490 [Verrucomicrobiota bacterium]|nr:hypothetical protein [Limisphaera sp.]MDW8380772.1 hypothetical protein [Verrucomicrobiota bacterium]